jgi:hypothetical protein
MNMSKHKIVMEKTINEVLTGEIKQNAMNFAAFLNANGFRAGGEHGAVIK